MSGHSKWSTIKHKKALADAKRASIFTKLAKNIAIAAGNGGNPDMNLKLRIAIDKARNENMPKDNIEKAIKRGTRELRDGTQIEEAIYEAYGPGNIAMLIKIATDNKNRTLAEVKNIISKNGGKMAEEGSVSWQFEQIGKLEVKKNGIDEEKIEMQIIESGARDYYSKNNHFVVLLDSNKLQTAREFLEDQDLAVKNPLLAYSAKNTTKLNAKDQKQFNSLMEALDENSDVVEIYDNISQIRNV
ncbi:MAG: YebC/PmpR family DNA-binding transcriptional regulator [Patescibacteria group bacterium]|nr:YebC/PmpR family DNA-binding transcriptional regulator [Patescibacteria group bacterium]